MNTETEGRRCKDQCALEAPGMVSICCFQIQNCFLFNKILRILYERTGSRPDKTTDEQRSVHKTVGDGYRSTSRSNICRPWAAVLGNEYPFSSLSKYFAHSGNTRQLAVSVSSNLPRRSRALFHHCLQCWSLIWTHCSKDGRPVSDLQSRNMAWQKSGFA